jgi:hypothetical protein
MKSDLDHLFARTISGPRAEGAIHITSCGNDLHVSERVEVEPPDVSDRFRDEGSRFPSLSHRIRLEPTQDFHARFRICSLTLCCGAGH